MPSLTVPVDTKMAAFLGHMVKRGYAPTRAGVAKKALAKLAEDEAIEAILISKREIAEGKILSGDIKKLLKKFK